MKTRSLQSREKYCSQKENKAYEAFDISKFGLNDSSSGSKPKELENAQISRAIISK